MALSAEQWLQTHFFPVVESLPAPGEVEQSASSPTAALAVISAMRLSGALDALVAVGAVDAEQHERCRSALAAKGVTSERVSHRAIGFVSGLVRARGSRGHAEADTSPDRLVRVLGDGHVFGLVEGEQAVLIAVEIWERTVHAEFLIAVDPAAEEARSERGRELADWFARKQAGEVPEGDRPPMPSAATHPGATTTWLLEVGGSSVEGRVAAGQGGGDWWRLGIRWDVAVGHEPDRLVLSATEQDRVVGRSTLSW
ncbi:MAG: hypothetical protein QOE05_1931 [Actinomycetota bacterium]|jgi:hypothetical protein|nr:hypothetical protein [Actinomycetota bacterium]